MAIHSFALKCRMLPLAMLVPATCIVVGCQGPQRKPGGFADRDKQIRAIWVTRWDYKRASDIATIMENCAQSGFNTVLFQVRGNGTAFYRSRLEPWAEELGGRYPGYDPLMVACREAHRRGLALHAWVNVMPGWRGKYPPTDRRQLYHARADWFWRDSLGRREPLGWYNSVNPCYPEVRRYLTDVMQEIATGYPVDGIHLDYIRFPNEPNEFNPKSGRMPDYPRDSRTLAMFRKETGLTPDRNPKAWKLWRADKVTKLVASVRRMLRRQAPRVQLSAAVGASLEKAKYEHFQDTRKWLAMGLLDAVYPMNYAESMPVYEKRLEEWAAMRPSVPVVVGVMFDGRGPGQVIEQTRRAQRRHSHFSAFAYNSLFERLDKQGRPVRDKQSRQRDDRRRQVIPELRRQKNRSI